MSLFVAQKSARLSCAAQECSVLLCDGQSRALFGLGRRVASLRPGSRNLANHRATCAPRASASIGVAFVEGTFSGAEQRRTTPSGAATPSNVDLCRAKLFRDALPQLPSRSVVQRRLPLMMTLLMMMFVILMLGMMMMVLMMFLMMMLMMNADDYVDVGGDVHDTGVQDDVADDGHCDTVDDDDDSD